MSGDMKAELKVVLNSSGNGNEFALTDYLCSGAAVRFKGYIEKTLAPVMETDKEKRAYLVWSRGYGWGIVDEKDGHFSREVLTQHSEWENLDIRRLEPGPDGGMRCTAKYTKTFREIMENWEDMGLAALDPPED